MQHSTWNLMLELGNYVSPELARSRKTKKNRKNRFEKNSYQGGAIQTSLAIQHNSYVFALKTHSHKQSLRSALSESKNTQQ